MIKVLSQFGPHVMGTRLWRSIMLGVVVCATVAGCNGADTAGLPEILPTIPYRALHLNINAIVMSTVAPYDTLQLHAAAYDGSGHVTSVPGTVTYVASDTTLTVSPNGLITVKHPSFSSTGTMIVATLQDTVQFVTHVDTAFVLTTSTTPASPLATYWIHQLAPGDSAILDYGGGDKTIPVTAIDVAGQTIPTSTLPAHFVSSNPDVATVEAATGIVSAENPGMVQLTASISYYGVTKSDSLRLLIGFPDASYLGFSQSISTTGQAIPIVTPLLYIGQGKSVGFYIQYFGATKPISALDVSFDDTTAVQASPAGLVSHENWFGTGTGNIAPKTIPLVLYDSVVKSTFYPYPLISNYCNPFPSPCGEMRMFPKAGTFQWHSSILGLSGTIVVVPEPISNP